MKSPFKFLDAFDLRDRDVFFGRDEEIDQLYRMVHKNRLVLVYGQSGTGKTSLVQCGLAGRYDATDWLPLFIRRGVDLNRSFAEALSGVLNQPLEVVTPGAIDEAYGRYLRPLYLIFDQLEELFILGKAEEQEQFIRTIAELHRAELPCRILFIIREEYLAALYEFEKTIPSLFDRRLRVESMNAGKVKDVLRRSFERFAITLEAPEDNLRQIIDNVGAGRAGIQLPYLQVYLDLLWQEEFARTPTVPAVSAAENPTEAEGFPALRFDTKEIEVFGEIGDVLGRFLERQRLELQERLKEMFPDATGNEINRILDVFVTEEGTKRPVTVERQGHTVVLGNIPAGTLDDLPAPVLYAALDLLERSRLLRITGHQAELAHDALAALIDQERTDEQRKLNEVNQRLRNALLEYQLYGSQELPSKRLLFDTQELLDKLRLSPELLDFYKETLTELKRRENAELEEKDRRLKEAEKTARNEGELRQQAEKSRRRAIRRGIGVWIFSIVASLAGIAFFRASQQAKLATEIAQAETARANAAKLEAAQSAEAALSSEEAALSSAIEAEKQESIALANETQAKSALHNLETANDHLVDNLLKDAANDILNLDYDAARQKLYIAISLGRKKPQVAGALLEIAYFFNETRRQAEAQKEVAIVASLLKKTVSFRQSADRPTFRAAMQNLLPNRFNELEARYYPVMAAVKGGTCEIVDGRPVAISAYQIARTKTTVWQYNLFLSAQGKDILDEKTYETTFKRPQAGWKGTQSMVFVSWYDALQYTNWLSEQRGFQPVYTIDQTQKDSNNFSDIDQLKWTVSMRKNAKGFRLPTEAEWTCAALKDPGDVNVWEWCWDWYADDPTTESTSNPTGPSFGRYRVIRGKEPGRRSPHSRTEQCGFRLARGSE